MEYNLLNSKSYPVCGEMPPRPETLYSNISIPEIVDFNWLFIGRKLDGASEKLYEEHL